jgi:hypothetical protein
MLLMSLACDVIALGSNQVEVEDDGILAFKPKNKAIYISHNESFGVRSCTTVC